MRNTSIFSSASRSGSHYAGAWATLFCTCLLLLSSCSNTSRPALHHKAPPPLAIDKLLTNQGPLQIQTFQQWIGLLHQFDGQITPYSQELLNDRQLLANARNNTAYQKALALIQQHIQSIQIPALKNEVSRQEQQLLQQASAWGKEHTYHDSYNDRTYQMGYEYGPDGMAGLVQDELSGAKTLADYQQAVEDAHVSLINFQAYQANASDKTAWDRSHQSDLQLMDTYHLSHRKVVVISLREEAMRVYDSGRLVKALHITSGRPEKPSLPGSWTIQSKQSPTVFKSDEPKGSPYWYPDTPITYAMLYHNGGYFLHDSWWRADYGPNTQFPHYDSSGDSFSFDGSHGCINISTDNAAWVYAFVSLNTPILIY